MGRVEDPALVMAQVGEYVAHVEEWLGLGSVLKPGSIHVLPCDGAEAMEVGAGEAFEVVESPYWVRAIAGTKPLPGSEVLMAAVGRLAERLEGAGWEIGPSDREVAHEEGGGLRLPMVAAGNPVDGFAVQVSGVEQMAGDGQWCGAVVFVGSPCFRHPAVRVGRGVEW
jgi:hypothetical protein